MSRNVVTSKDVARLQAQTVEFSVQSGMGRPAPAPFPITEDGYKDRLLKYIPADVVAAYLALKGFVALLRDPAPIATIHWILFAIVWVSTIPWQRKIAKITKWRQVWIGTGAFAVWAISLGEPFSAENISWYQPAYGALLLALYTFLLPLLDAE